MDHAASPSLPNVASFSYSWPTSKPTPQLDARVDHGDIAAFTGAESSQCSFDFWQSLPEQTAAMAYGDEMFHDGLLLPLQLVSHGGEEDGVAGHKKPALLRSLSLDSSQRMLVSASKRHQLSRPASLNSSPSTHRSLAAATARSSSLSKGTVFRNSKLRLPTFGRCMKPHRWISSRYLRLLVPLYQRIARCITTSKKEDCSHHAEHCNGKVRDLGEENAIRDAILHCKRSQYAINANAKICSSMVGSS